MSRERGIFVSTRRGVSAMLLGGAAVAMSVPLALLAKVAPPTFDAAAFIADMAAANVAVVKHRGNVFLQGRPSFGKAFEAAMLRWADARDQHPDWLDRVAALLPEYETTTPTFPPRFSLVEEG